MWMEKQLWNRDEFKTQTATQFEQDAGRYAEIKVFKTQWLEESFKERPNTLGDNLNSFPTFGNDKDVEDEDSDDEESNLGKLSEDNEPSWVVGTTCKTVRHCIESFWQTQMRLHKLTHSEQGDTVDNFNVRSIMYGTTELRALVIIKVTNGQGCTRTCNSNI